MSLLLTSPDLARLQLQGYALELRGAYLLVHDVPYVDSSRTVRRGTLVTNLDLSGEVTTTPSTHVAMFIGSMPCDSQGNPLDQISHSGAQQLTTDLTVDFSFSSKPPEGYPDYHAKMSTYANILASPAQELDPTVSALTHRTLPVPGDQEQAAPFAYRNTASSRAGIDVLTDRLRQDNIAIIGLGGTGSYVLDLIAKTPVRQIHLYDGDHFLQHNAFRAPGAASLAELQAIPTKVDYLAARYSCMHTGIRAHHGYLHEGNLTQLDDVDFAFICLDDNIARATIATHLRARGIAFIDTGMGLIQSDDGGPVSGLVRTTCITPTVNDHLEARLPLHPADGRGDNAYTRNIQIADLNALNAAHAVIRWKKLRGFYADLDHEHHSIYVLDAGRIVTEDHRAD